ncbi:DegV family protein [Chloroflexota bacterium]
MPEVESPSREIMSKVRIITDSTNCLPLELIEKYNISTVPVNLVIAGKAYRDCIDITLEEICQHFQNLDKQPTTTAVSPGDFINTFTELGRTTDTIVCILVSKSLTATHESAYQARRLIRPSHPNLNIEIIDSKTSAGALGFVVLEAARAAEQNKNLEEIVSVTRDMISRVIYLAALDTLKYLINIGRAPRSTVIGEMLNVKPIIGFVDDTGLIEVVARVRGKHKSIVKIVNLVDKYIDTDRPIHAMVHYSDGIEVAIELKNLITTRYNCAEIYLAPFSPVMVSATGPMVGMSFYS